MNAETISIVVSVVAVGTAVGSLTITGLKQVREDIDRRFTDLREDMREVRSDVNTLREAVGSLREAVRALKERDRNAATD